MLLANSNQLAVLVALCEAVEKPVLKRLRTPSSRCRSIWSDRCSTTCDAGVVTRGLACAFTGARILADLLSHRSTPDRIHLWAAAEATVPAVHERLCLDLQRLKRCPEIIEALWENESVDRYLLRPPVEFLVREGVHLESVPLFKEVLASLSFDELRDAVDQVELPPEVAALVDEGETVKTEPEQPTQEEESSVAADEEPEEEEGAKKTLVRSSTP